MMTLHQQLKSIRHPNYFHVLLSRLLCIEMCKIITLICTHQGMNEGGLENVREESRVKFSKLNKDALNLLSSYRFLSAHCIIIITFDVTYEPHVLLTSVSFPLLLITR